MKKYFYYLFIIIPQIFGFSQEKISGNYTLASTKPIDTLCTKKFLFSYNAYLKNERQNLKKLIRLSEHYPKANSSFRKARMAGYYIAITTIGGIVLDVILKNNTDPRENKEQTITINISGLFVIIPAILFIRSYNKHLLNGVHYFNKGL